MARILVFFGTTNGHTAKIAQAIADTLRKAGNDVDILEAGTEWPEPEDYAAIVVAASVHAGGYQPPVRRWVRANATTLNGRPPASYTDWVDLRAFAEAFVQRVQHEGSTDSASSTRGTRVA